MQLRRQGQTTDVKVPAMNILTQKVRVSPYGAIDFTTGFRISGCQRKEGEIGFGVWGRPHERIKLEAAQFETLYGIAGTATNTTASESTIATIAANDDEFIAITALDLDIHNAEQQGAVTYRVFGAFHYHPLEDNIAVLFSIGGAAEFPRNYTTAFSQWSAWASLGVAF